MIKRCCQWMNSHRKATACLILVCGTVLLNGMAFMHAHAMTHYTDGGARTAKPDELSVVDKVQVLFTGVRIPRPQNTVTPDRHGLEHIVHSFSPEADVHCEGWYIPCSDPRGLCIMFPGYAASKAKLLPEAVALNDMNFDTFLIDFRGSGGSSGNVSTIGWLEANDVAAAVSYARENLTADPVVLYGQSMGSVAILRACSQSELDVQCLMLECPFDRLLTTTRNRFTKMNLPSFPFAELLVFWGGTQHGFSGFDHNPADYAAHVTHPVLLMSGEDDERVTEKEVKLVFDHLPGEKQLVMYANTGHQACIGGDTALWRESVDTFFSKYSEVTQPP